MIKCVGGIVLNRYKFIILFLFGYLMFVVVHEDLHDTVFRIYDVPSSVHYEIPILNSPWAYTIGEMGKCQKNCGDVLFLQALIEIVGYYLIWIYSIVMVVFFTIRDGFKEGKKK